MRSVNVGGVVIGGGRPFALIAGPCVIESVDHALRTAHSLAVACRARDIPLVYKSSFDKANRTSGSSFRGVGIELGLAALARVRREIGIPVTTDIHEPAQAAIVAKVVDLIQIPAFLCRQTDLVVAAGATGKPVNLKKAQHMAPGDMKFAAEKVKSRVLLTERGTAFGYGDLVVDFRSLAEMRQTAPVVLDVTHSAQRREGAITGGDRALAEMYGRAGLAVGVDAIFAEVHPDPARAPSDAATQIPMDQLDRILGSWQAVYSALNP